VRAQATGGLGGEACEALREVVRRQAAAVCQPGRQREVQQGHHGLDAGGPEPLDFISVVGPRVLGPGPLARLYPAPFDREPVGVGAQFADQLNVFGDAVPVIGSLAGAITFLDATLFFFELCPVVPPVAAFDLMGCCGDTPKEALRGRRGEGLDRDLVEDCSRLGPLESDTNAEIEKRCAADQSAGPPNGESGSLSHGFESIRRPVRGAQR